MRSRKTSLSALVQEGSLGSKRRGLHGPHAMKSVKCAQQPSAVGSILAQSCKHILGSVLGAVRYEESKIIGQCKQRHASQVALVVENHSANAGDRRDIPGSGRSPEEEMAPHSSILARRIPCTEEPSCLQSMGS